MPGVGIKGTLGFLQLTAEEDVDGDEPSDTHLAATFAIDIVNGRTTPTDERLGFTELGRIGFDARFGADAVVDLAMRSLSSDLVPTAATSRASWPTSCSTGASGDRRRPSDTSPLGDLDGGFLRTA